MHSPSYPGQNACGVAEDFTVGQLVDRWTINRIETYNLDNADGFDRPLTVALYKDNGSGGVVSLLYSDIFTLPQSGGWGWRGVSELSWEIGAGNYWIGIIASAYSVRYLQGGDARMILNSSGAWTSDSGNNLGLRIYGDETVVPIPGAVWLLGAGLIGLVGLRRKSNK